RDDAADAIPATVVSPVTTQLPTTPASRGRMPAIVGGIVVIAGIAIAATQFGPFSGATPDNGATQSSTDSSGMNSVDGTIGTASPTNTVGLDAGKPVEPGPNRRTLAANGGREGTTPVTTSTD